MDLAPAIIDRVLHPRSIALVGASERSPFSVRIHDNLVRAGFIGDLVVVNPRRDEVFGRPCVASLADVPPVDLAVLSIPREGVEAAVEDALAAGCAGLVVLAVGFRDSGEPEWRAAEERIAARIRDAGRILVGPNGLGVVMAGARAAAIGAPVWWDARPGRIALAMQSGALLHSAMICLDDLGAAVGYAISTGNGTGTSIGDWAAIFAAQDDVATIGLLIEELGSDWQVFAAAALEARQRGKRLVALKMGHTAVGRAVAQSHTGALAGEYAVFRDALRQVGATEAGTFGEFVGLLALLERFGEPTARGAAIFSPTGGTNGLMADLCAAEGVTIADVSTETAAALRSLPDFTGMVNPLDLNARWSFDLDALEEGVAILMRDPAVGVGIFGVPLLPDEHFEPIIATLARIAKVTAEVGKPLLLTEVGYGKVDHVLADFLAAHPCAMRVPSAREAIAIVRLWSDHLAVPGALSIPSSDPIPVQWRNERDLKAILADRLAASPVAVPSSAWAEWPWSGTEPELAKLAADRTTFAKVLGPTILHKGRLGLLAGPLHGPEAVNDAAIALIEAVKDGGHHVDGLLLEAAAPDGLDLIVGLVRQPIGLALMVGTGGADVEDRARCRFAILPVEPAHLELLLHEVADEPLETEIVNAIADLVLVLAEMVEADGLQSIECNPVRITPDGVAWILDALAMP